MSRTFELPSRVLVASSAVLIASLFVSGCATTSQDGAAGSSATETAETAAPHGDEAHPSPSEYFAGSGTDDIDVESYALDASVTIDGADHLDGSATVVATAVAGHELATFELDLVGLEVAEVMVNGSGAAFSRTETKLVITPAAPVADGAEFTTTVRYSGDPSQRGDATEALEDGGGWVDVGDYSAVLAEPIGARTWLPSNDRPSDKALVSMHVEVPAGVVAVSNGRLLDRSDDGRTASFHWVADEPMAPYLITLAIGDFELTTESIPGGPEVINAVPLSVTALGAARFEAVPSMLSFFGERFGPYPFSTVGGVIVPGLPPTALECQTRPVYSFDAISEDDQGQLVAHELAHQWFGDAVTPASWNDIWLNEGPAVYSQWLWLETVGGPSVLDSARTSYDPDDEALAVPPAAPGEAEMFGTSVYERSAIFLVELRERLGTEQFDELMRTWVADHRFGNSSTEDFVELAGSIAGTSIEDLSTPWLYRSELPELSF